MGTICDLWDCATVTSSTDSYQLLVPTLLFITFTPPRARVVEGNLAVLLTHGLQIAHILHALSERRPTPPTARSGARFTEGRVVTVARLFESPCRLQSRHPLIAPILRFLVGRARPRGRGQRSVATILRTVARAQVRREAATQPVVHRTAHG